MSEGVSKLLSEQVEVALEYRIRKNKGTPERA